MKHVIHVFLGLGYVMICSSTHFLTNDTILFFLWLTKVPLCTYTTFSVWIHQLMGM